MLNDQIGDITMINIKSFLIGIIIGIPLSAIIIKIAYVFLF